MLNNSKFTNTMKFRKLTSYYMNQYKWEYTEDQGTGFILVKWMNRKIDFFLNAIFSDLASPTDFHKARKSSQEKS